MSLSNCGSFRPNGAWKMNRRMRSHLPLSPIAMSSARTTATARMSKRHISGESASPPGGPGNARTGANRIRRTRQPRPRCKPHRNGRVRPEKQGRRGKDDHEESGFRDERRPEDADIADRREPRPIDHHAADATEGEEENDDGNRHAEAAPAHTPSRSCHRLPAAAASASIGFGASARTVVRSKPSFGPRFSDSAELMKTFALSRFSSNPVG